MKNNLPISRIKDYEFLGIYNPNPEAQIFFYVYDLVLDNNISGRVFYSSVYNNVLMKGDIVEYELKQEKLVVRIPKKQKVDFIKHKV